MCDFATIDIFQLAKELGTVSTPYSAEDLKKLSEANKILREEKLLEDLYGPLAKLDSEVWISEVETTCQWVLKAKLLRHEVFKQAEVTYVNV